MADCEGIAEGDRSKDVHLSRLKELATFCFTTSDDRTGFFVVDTVELEDNGSLDQLDLSFTVFKGSEDL